MKKLLIFSVIVFGWLLILCATLYLPKLHIFSKNDNTLHIFTWGDILDPSVITAFERETGIKVHLSYYASNEELLVKMRATKGEGYDLIIPSDYAAGLLIKERLLKRLDKAALPFWSTISPNLLGHTYDPYNHYTIPFSWEVFLLGVNENYFTKETMPKSWGAIFNPKDIDYKISMTNDPLEATAFASLYLFGPKQFLTNDEIQQVKDLLTLQKRWVEVYASFRGDFFLGTGSCQVAVASSSYLQRAQKSFPFISLVIPEEGSFISIENLCIPKSSKKKDINYQFINYLFKESSIKSQFETYGFFPSTLHANTNIELTPSIKNLLHLSQEEFKKFYFLHEVMEPKQMMEIWIEVKSGK